jgi:hypothetical protein
MEPPSPMPVPIVKEADPWPGVGTEYPDPRLAPRKLPQHYGLRRASDVSAGRQRRRRAAQHLRGMCTWETLLLCCIRARTRAGASD